MNNHIKLVLKPLLVLRKSVYRLFGLEREEQFYRDLTLFKDKNDFGQFLTIVQWIFSNGKNLNKLEKLMMNN